MTNKSVVTDTLETLLNLVIETIGEDDVAIFNGGRIDPGVMSEEWHVMAYWRDARTIENPDAEGWEIDVHSDTLRGALCQAIAHPRFGQ
jgi:hypothetical protein